MEKVSIIIPVFNQIETTLDCIANIREFNKDSSLFEIIVVDNGSTDDTPQVLSNDKGIVYIRNKENVGLSKAYNSAARQARYNILCFMHNDVFVYEDNWVSTLSGFICKTQDAGIVGLYGAKTIRKDGSFRGKTIVHSKKDSPSISGPFERVAIVDGLLMAMHRDVLEKVGGFNEGFTIHYYDKDISMRALLNKMHNYVISIPFEHLCAATRKNVSREKSIRDEAQKRFIEIWHNFLPADVTTWKEKLSYIFKRK